MSIIHVTLTAMHLGMNQPAKATEMAGLSCRYHRRQLPNLLRLIERGKPQSLTDILLIMVPIMRPTPCLPWTNHPTQIDTNIFQFPSILHLVGPGQGSLAYQTQEGVDDLGRHGRRMTRMTTITTTTTLRAADTMSTHIAPDDTVVLQHHTRWIGNISLMMALRPNTIPTDTMSIMRQRSVNFGVQHTKLMDSNSQDNQPMSLGIRTAEEPDSCSNANMNVSVCFNII